MDDEFDELLLLSVGFHSDISFSLSELESLSDDLLSLEELLLSLLESLSAASLFLLFDFFISSSFFSTCGGRNVFLRALSTRWRSANLASCWAEVLLATDLLDLWACLWRRGDGGHQQRTWTGPRPRRGRPTASSGPGPPLICLSFLLVSLSSTNIWICWFNCRICSCT